MSVLDQPTESAPEEQDPHRQGAKRSKEARKARQAARAAAQEAGEPKQPRGPKEPKQPRQPKAKQHKSAEAGRGRGAPTSTAVNLLSPWVLEELKVHQMRQRFLLGALGLLVVLGLATGAMRLHLSNLQQELEDEQQLSAGLQSQINGLADVKRYVGEVTVRTADVEGAMATDVTLSAVYRALDKALPDGATFDAITVSMPTAELLSNDPGAPVATPTCPGPDPFNTKPVVGCIAFSGSALTRADVSTLIEALDKSDLFVEPFVDTTAIQKNELSDLVDFTASAGVSEAALTERFTDIDGSDADQTGDAGDTESDES